MYVIEQVGTDDCEHTSWWWPDIKKVMFFMGSHSPPNVAIGRIRHPAVKKAVRNVIGVTVGTWNHSDTKNFKPQTSRSLLHSSSWPAFVDNTLRTSITNSNTIGENPIWKFLKLPERKRCSLVLNLRKLRRTQYLIPTSYFRLKIQLGKTQFESSWNFLKGNDVA